MIGILLITHGTFGESLIQNVCQVLNKRPALIGQIGVAAQDDPLDMLPLAHLRLGEVDEGDGVLIMTDILGATPSNIGLKLLVPGRVEGVAGVSLPMLLRVLTYRQSSMEVVLQKAISGGHDGVICMPLA
jgi:PTS system ascorbate-specific IIA component